MVFIYWQLVYIHNQWNNIKTHLYYYVSYLECYTP